MNILSIATSDQKGAFHALAVRLVKFSMVKARISALVVDLILWANEEQRASH